MLNELNSCSNCGTGTENEPVTLCDECMEDDCAGSNASHALVHAKQTLETVKDHMDEFAYSELASALNP